MSDDTPTKKSEKPAQAAPGTDKTVEAVEAHAQAAGTPSWQFAGVKARHGWPAGKTMPRKDYDQAVAEWLKGPTAPHKEAEQ